MKSSLRRAHSVLDYIASHPDTAPRAWPQSLLDDLGDIAWDLCADASFARITHWRHMDALRKDSLRARASQSSGSYSLVTAKPARRSRSPKKGGSRNG